MGIIFQVGEGKKDGRVERSALKIGGDGKRERKEREQNLSRGRYTSPWKLWSFVAGIYRMFQRRHRSGHG